MDLTLIKKTMSIKIKNYYFRWLVYNNRVQNIFCQGPAHLVMHGGLVFKFNHYQRIFSSNIDSVPFVNNYKEYLKILKAAIK